MIDNNSPYIQVSINYADNSKNMSTWIQSKTFSLSHTKEFTWEFWITESLKNSRTETDTDHFFNLIEKFKSRLSSNVLMKYWYKRTPWKTDQKWVPHSRLVNKINFWVYRPFKLKSLTEFGNFDLTISFFAELPETFPFTGCNSAKTLSYLGYVRLMSSFKILPLFF